MTLSFSPATASALAISCRTSTGRACSASRARDDTVGPFKSALSDVDDAIGPLQDLVAIGERALRVLERHHRAVDALVLEFERP